MKMKKTQVTSLVRGVGWAMLGLSALSVHAADDAIEQARNAERQLNRSADVGTAYAANINSLPSRTSRRRFCGSTMACRITTSCR
jgi:hypothetical protein